MKNGICYVVCAGENPGTMNLRKEEGDCIIAADAGLKSLAEKSIKPDIILGDFDSLGYVPDFENVIVHKPEKDDTDSVLSVMKGFELGYLKFVIYGALGGERIDHEIANLQLLNYIAKRGGRGYIVSGRTLLTAFCNGSLAFFGDENGYFSVFSVDAKACGVTIENAKFKLNDAVLNNLDPIGTSNEFIGKPCRISVKEGTLLVTWSGDRLIW